MGSFNIRLTTSQTSLARSPRYALYQEMMVIFEKAESREMWARIKAEGRVNSNQVPV
jgi:hypothetical protein